MFSFIKRWFDKKEAEMEARNKAYRERAEERLKIRKERLEKERMKMLESYCPIRDDKCVSSCIHYSCGYAKLLEWHDGKLYVRGEPPYCKLWSKK